MGSDRPRTRGQRHRPTGRGGRWVPLLVVALARSVASLSACLTLWSIAPAALGWQPTVVMSDSMRPRVAAGDVVVARPVPVGQLQPGQVLLVTDPDRPERLRLHRLVQVRPDGLVLRGDANDQPDSTPVKPDAVHGVGVLRVPVVGLPLVWAHQGRLGHLGLVAAAALLLAWAALRPLGPVRAPVTPGQPEAAPGQSDGSRDQSDASPGEPEGSPGQPDASPCGAPARGWHPARSGTAAILVLGAALAPAVGGPVPTAAAAFGTSTANPASSWGAAPYFTCRSAVLAASPFLHLPLGETSGATAADASGNGRNGTYQGGLSRGVGGACAVDNDPAVTLNGTSGYVSTATKVTNPTEFTLEIWFRTTTASGGQLMGFGSSQTGASVRSDRHLYLADTGQLVFGVDPTTPKTIVSPLAYNDGAWHLAHAVLSTAGMQLYVDGALVATGSTTSARNFAGYWRIGYDNLASWSPTASSSYFSGTLDEAAVYPRALTAAEIVAHRAAAL